MKLELGLGCAARQEILVESERTRSGYDAIIEIARLGIKLPLSEIYPGSGIG